METVELDIESLAYRGAGVGRRDGIVYFVLFTCPGDHISAEVTRKDSRFREARLKEILQPSPYRTEPLCRLFGRCGSCSFQHVAYDTQVREKIAMVSDAVHSSIPLPERGVEAVASPLAYGYRGTARFAVAPSGRLGFRMQKSDTVIEVEHCPILCEPLDVHIDVVNRHIERIPVKPLEVELTVAEDDSVHESFHFPDVPFDPGFTQANRGVNALLKAAVLKEVCTHAADIGGIRVLDLYAGDGNLSLPLASLAERISGYDASHTSIRKAMETVREQGYRNVSYTVQKVEEALKTIKVSEYTCVVADPPRGGLSGGQVPVAKILAMSGI
ncbi:MAG TPA: methyltransferase domain-containing protein, partial [Spirochaetia bacterium]|nr:methyltransferase domain-containing protein [Spirochaetia bacterium]